MLAASLAARLALSWLAAFALAPFAIGLVSYPVVLARFDYAQLRSGMGDHWVAGGAIAISALPCAAIAQAAMITHTLGAAYGTLRAGSVVLWALAIAWLPILVVAEVRWPRPRYDIRRWATVFPLGMIAVMSVAVGEVSGENWIRAFGEGWAWVALTAWLVVAAGAVRQARVPAVR